MLFRDSRQDEATRTKISLANHPIPSEWYDETYFSGRGKSNWKTKYDWYHFGHIFEKWAKFLIYGFPDAETFLDVGCATGMLERAFAEIVKRNGFKKCILGFDHSKYAIDNAEPGARTLVSSIELASVDDFDFRRDRYDVMVCLDVLEHLTESQSKRFLERSRNHVNDCLFAVIALDQEHQRGDESHINLRSREYWHELLTECGWSQPEDVATMQLLASREYFVKSCRAEIFIYKS